MIIYMHVYSVYKGHSNVLLNMAFISSSEVENVFISLVPKPCIKYTYFYGPDEVKAIFF